MITCLSPNGRVQNSGTGPATTLHIGTLRGLYTFTRKSIDDDWQQTAVTLEDKHVSCLLYEENTQRLFAGFHGYEEHGGIVVSTDGGRTWEPRIGGLESVHVYTLAAEKRGDDIILYAGTEPPAFYRSKDLGKHWEEIPGVKKVPGTDKWTFPPPPHIAHVKWSLPHPNKPGTIYVLVEQGALLVSEDDCQSWRELDAYESPNDSFYRDVHRVAIANNSPGHLYLAAGDGLYFSTDAGESWVHQQKRTDRVGYPDALYIDPDDDNTVYLGGAGDAPETWRKEGGAFPGFIVSHDGGITWTETMQGLPQPIHGNIEAMDMYYWPIGDNKHAVSFYAGTAVGDVFTSDDRGHTWKLLATGLPPISKARHYRHFLTEDQKLSIETEAMKERKTAGMD